MSEEGKSEYLADTRRFLQSKHAEESHSPALCVRAKAKTAKAPRTAALDWLHAVQNSFEAGKGHGLERWLCAPRAWDADEVPGEREQGVCVFLMDQESKQWAAAYYLMNKVKGSFCFLWGPIHRRNNDCDRACIAAGLYSVHIHDSAPNGGN